MKLLVLRHAIAEDPLDWAARGNHGDEGRPLTAEGKSRMKRGAAALAALVPDLELIATSPYTRAAQTAALLAKTWPRADVVEVAALGCGGSRQELVDWLLTRSEQTLAIVGHEPDLGLLVAWLLAGRDSGAFALRKGGACLLQFADRPGEGAGLLRWFLPPSLLRSLAP